VSYAPPPILVELESTIGLAAALELVSKCGGTREYIPMPSELSGRDPAASRLARFIGIEAAQKLAAMRGGDRIDVPRCAGLLRQRRDLEIVRRLDAGETARSLAREFCLTERSIWTIASRDDLAEIQSNQLDLPWSI
jgi:hypothetical protein